MSRVRPAALDALLGVALVMSAVASRLHEQGTGGVALGLAAATVLWSGAVAIRSTAPLAMAAVASFGILAFALIPGHASHEPFVSTLVVTFATGAQLRGRRVWLGAVLLITSGYAVNYDDPADRSTVNLLLTPLVLFGAPLAAGAVVRRSRDQQVQLQVLTTELLAERQANAHAAAAAERNRIARDLHDVVAHSVSVMVVQAGAAETQLPGGAPAQVQVAAMRRTGKETLLELRRQLRVLRDAEVPT